MTNERVKTLPAKELDHFLSTEIFYEQTRRKHGQESKRATNFQFSAQNCPKWRNEEAKEDWLSDYLFISRVIVWTIFTATNFDISSSVFCDAQVKIFHAGSTETIFLISTSCSCWDFFIFNMIYVHWICFQTRGSLFFLSCSRHQKHPEEAL